MRSITIMVALLGVAMASPAPNPFEPTPALAKRFATKTMPASSGYSVFSTPKVVTGTFDGGMKKFDRGVSCTGDAEGGDSDAVFQIESGGTLKNVIIGKKQIEGVHCMGPCTIQNVWWEDVCEDALTIKQTSGTSYVTGGGAFHASDKIVQHNGGGTVSIKDFYAEDFGKVYRSCGNCKTQYKRTVQMSGVWAVDGSLLAGINSNYGDTATIADSCADDVNNICTWYQGNNNGKEPKKLGSGPSSYCIYSDSEVDDCPA
ncbi:pectate lyase [Hortaea werneckii]|nr:pectate lyase [Hortaea werneckii]